MIITLKKKKEKDKLIKVLATKKGEGPVTIKKKEKSYAKERRQ